jgi:pimeloyl-ACP methyl ester carboxylesterase
MTETFVIVHGAWQNAAAWSAVVKRLEANGHTAVAVDLPGRDIASGENQPSLEDYRRTVLAAVEAAGVPVTLVGHSFGGFTISNVAEAAPASIKTLVYVAAYLPVTGESLQTLSATDSGSSFTQENFVMAPDWTYAEVLERDRALIFANDAPPDLQRRITTALVREPLAPLAEKVTLSADRFGKVRKVYVRTMRDHAVSPALQDRMLARTTVAKVLAIDTGHAPSLTNPDGLALLLAEAAA